MESRGCWSDYSEVDPYYAEIKRIKPLTKDKESEYHERIKKDPNDTEAREELVKRCLGLPIRVAKEYSGRGVSFADLIQEGNMGLVHALNSFDPSRGYRLFTYAYSAVYWCVYKAISEKSSLVHIPKGVQKESYSKLARKSKKTGKARAPKPEGLSQPYYVSLSSRCPDTLPDSFVTDPQGLIRFDESSRTMDNEKINLVLLKFIKLADPKGRDIIKMHFGLGKYKHPLTFRQIGEKYGMGTYKVAAMYRHAIEKLARYRHRIAEYAV